MASTNRPAAGGGRIILVPPQRFPRWIDGFDTRHRVTNLSATKHGLLAMAADGAVADCRLPLEAPLPEGAPETDPQRGWGALLEFVADAAGLDRRVGVIFARKAAIAVGLFNGDRLEKSKVDTSYVQGRTAAGGWSQQRYARRRSNQAKAAAGKAADIVHRVLPEANALDALVTAGDKETVGAIVADSRLADLAAKAVEPHIGDVGEPRLAALRALPETFGAVRIHLRQPEE